MLTLFSFFVVLIVNLNCISAQYTVNDTSDCVFPFTYNGKSYTGCLDKDRKYPWCSLTSKFKGAWKYCYDMTQTSWKCKTNCFEDDKEDYPYCYTKDRTLMYCVDKVISKSKLTKKPVGSCSEDYKKISPEHTACLAPLANVAKSGMTKNEKNLVVDLHNEWRRKVDETAAGMVKMYWDDDLAYVAQKHAERCSFYHDDMTLRSIPGTGKYPGQNIIMVTGSADFNWTFDFNEMYAGELKRWKYGVGIRPEFKGKTAYHYTQIIIEHLTKLGCGYAECLFWDRIEKIFVCNYDSMQKAHEIIEPYKKGKSCESCPNNCENKLCDCKGLQCFNSGSLDVSTCTCKCHGFWKGRDCSEAIKPVQNQTTGCWFPFVFNDVVYNDCATTEDNFRFCSKSPVVDENTEFYDCNYDPSQDADRDKRSVDSQSIETFSDKIKNKLRKKRSVFDDDLPNEESMNNSNDGKKYKTVVKKRKIKKLKPAAVSTS